MTARDRLGVLDLARGLAALAVCAGHVRSFVFVDFSEAQTSDVFWKAFYAATGVGHAAVIVFFVLSGFLIGDHVWQLIRHGEWSWRVYATKRLTRLWIVLIPALLVTALLDQLGMALTDFQFYSGTLYDAYHSGPRTELVPASYSLTTLFLNVAFLQTIVAPTFGTNGPLWSLANEFWYYVIFPLGLLTFDANQRPVYRAICCAVVVGLLVWLPMGILDGGLIWLFGFFAAYLTRRIQWSRRRKHLAICALFGIFLVALVANRFEPTDWGDIAIGVSFAALLIPAARASLWSSLVRQAATLLADMSYTLYLVHFPIVTFIVAALGIPRMVPGLWSLALYAALLVGVLCMSSLVYLMFERHTPALQRWLLKRFAAPQRASSSSRLLARSSQ